MIIKNSNWAARFFGAAISFFALCVVLLTSTTARAQYASTDFLVADHYNGRIAVFDSNFNFLRYLDTTMWGITGLDIMPNGNLIAARQLEKAVSSATLPNEIRIYDRSGNVLSSYSDVNMWNPFEVKASSSNMFYVATQNSTYSISEFYGDGSYSRSFDTKDYSSVVILPGNVMWAGGFFNFGSVDVFDLQTGTKTGTFMLDGGQQTVNSMLYSQSSGTVLTTGNYFVDKTQAQAGFNTPVVFERDVNGNLLRTFYSMDAPSSYYGVTRSANGDVYATDYQNNRIYHWDQNATYINSIDVSTFVNGPMNIVWAGNHLAPTAANVSISGKVLNNFGAGIANATVTMTDSNGSLRQARTNSFGSYVFSDVAAGQTYVLNATAKGLQFAPQIFNVSDNVTDVVFTPQTTASGVKTAGKLR